MTQHVSDPRLAPSAPRATRVRHGVVVFAVTLAVITYIDRICISQAAPLIQDDLGLSKKQMGFAFAAFFWAYALFEIPGGWMGDRWGARRILMRIVVWWSFFTAATGWAWNLASLVVARALFGAGEAGCFPNITKMFATWLPARERVRAQGIMWLGARWGGAFTPLLVMWVLQWVSWRRAFELFAAIGVVWAVFFYRWYRDNPRDNPRLNDAERALIPKAAEVALGHGPVPWRALLTSRTVWLLWGQYVCLCYGYTFYVTWLPTYLRDARGVDVGLGALLAGVPLFFSGIGSFFSGFAVGRIDRWTGDTRRTRRWLAGTGCAGAAACLVLSVHIRDPIWAMIAMGLASFSNDLAVPPSWAACMDVGGRVCGTLSGGMNMIGTFGGSLAPIMTGFLLDWTHQNWAVTFYVSAAVYCLGAVCWALLDPVTPLFPPAPETAHPNPDGPPRQVNS